MSTIITLDNGRQIGGPTGSMGHMLELIADELPEEFLQMKRWLLDNAERCAPCMDFDVRGFPIEARAAFWSAARQAAGKITSEYAESNWAGNRILLLLRMYDGIEPLEEGEDLKPYDECQEVDFAELWFADS